MTTADDVCNTPHERGPQVVEHPRAADPLTRHNRGGAAVKATHTQHEDPSQADSRDDAQKVTEALRPVVEHRRHYGLHSEDAEVYAATVLAALDLPARDARVRAETLRDAADEIALPGVLTRAGYFGIERAHGYRQAERESSDWLANRAAAIKNGLSGE